MPRLTRGIKAASQVLLGKRTAGRNLTVFADDLYLVSYPRSGNTWTRFLIGNLVHQDDPVTFKNVEARIPEIYLFPDRVLRALPRPRMLKSHECFDPRYKKIIYVVRDPRDVAVSYYHYAIKLRWIDPQHTIDQFVPRFIEGEFDVKAGWLACWIDHVISWVSTRGENKGFLLLRYEDLIQNTEQQLARVARFLNLDPTPQRLKRAVELSSADHMRQLEKKESHHWQLTRKSRQDKPFVRSAKAGNWQEALAPESVASIESAWGSAMRAMGYTLSTAPTSKDPTTTVTVPL